jgi:membrane protease YdiL (CAAX protease family)
LGLLAVVVASGALWRLLSVHGVRLLPLDLARTLSLQAFLSVINVVTLVFGLILSTLLLDHPWRRLGLTLPRRMAVVRVVLATPAVYVAASYLAVLIALPTLLEEIRSQGVEGVRQSTGEFGSQVLRSPAVLTLLWAAVIAPVAEELWFRGALWALLADGVARLWRSPVPVSEDAALPEGVVAPSRVLEVAGSASRWLREGGIATLLSAAVFAAFHADMPGGMGIVRVVSAAGLGLACGVARQATGSTVAAIALHCVFNVLSLATARRWVVTSTFPTRLMVPTLLSLLAVLSLVLLALIVVFSRRRARQKR